MPLFENKSQVLEKQLFVHVLRLVLGDCGERRWLRSSPCLHGGRRTSQTPVMGTRERRGECLSASGCAGNCFCLLIARGERSSYFSSKSGSVDFHRDSLDLELPVRKGF